MTALLFIFIGQLQATHNRAGEITYVHLFDFTYEVTILTCTDITLASNADREWLPIDWGHGFGPDSIQRTLESIVVAGQIKRNEYTTTHSFPGPGTFNLYVEDPNRNAGINNIPTSIDKVFSITTVLVISSNPTLGGFNNSVQLLNPPKGDACTGSLWLHNPAAFDPDGDSLSYELIPCTESFAMPIEGYLIPSDWPSDNAQGSIQIDQFTGTVTWTTPLLQGEYNLCIRISEYRNGSFVGSVVRDMQVNVFACNNEPPEIAEIPDTCVLAGTNIAIQIEAVDPDNHEMFISLDGETFLLEDNPSTFTQTSISNPAEGSYQWAVNCDQVRLAPYSVFVTATDNGTQSADLSDVEQFFISVVAPPVENLTAVGVNGVIQVDWDNNFCDNATGYKIYRRLGPNDFEPSMCQTGIPEGEGYQLIGQVNGWDNSSYDDTDVPFGFEACYRVVACFADGAESIVSDEDCATIGREIPIITHASVGATDLSAGRDTVRWLAPNEIDTITDFLGPYFYKVYRIVGLAGDDELVETTTPTAILDNQIGFEFIDTGINTVEFVHSYRIDFFNTTSAGEEQFVSSSNLGPSIFLQTAPLDAAMSLSWSDFQPWNNFDYEVFVFDEGLSDFVSLGTTSETSFIHSDLINGTEYCYYIRALGEYDPLSMIPGPFVNFSQEKCASPIDLTPPCPPALDLIGECELGNYQLLWSDPNDFCTDDVTEYNVYYSPTQGTPLEFLMTIEGSTDTTFIPEEEFPIGCYYVTALDTRIEDDGSMVMNESVPSDTICLAGCPDYTLPNVISPNNDGTNDEFMPFEPWGYVESIDLKVFNRWGNLVFETIDPNIDWDGKNKDSGELVSDGVYFYTIVINEITLDGIVPRNESGTIHLFGSGNQEGE